MQTNLNIDNKYILQNIINYFDINYYLIILMKKILII